MFQRNRSPIPLPNVIHCLLADWNRYQSDCKAETNSAFIQFKYALEPVELRTFIHSKSSHFPRFFWEDRDTGDQLFGAGIAEIITQSSQKTWADAVSAVTARVQDLKDYTIHFIGGLAFDKSNTTPEWPDFGAGVFVLPRIQFVVQNLTPLIVFTFSQYGDGSFSEQLDDICTMMTALLSVGANGDDDQPIPTSVTHHPDLTQWLKGMTHVQSRLASGQYEKIVLARKTVVTFPQPFSPEILFQRLYDYQVKRFAFYLQPKSTQAFMGCSPELLFARSGAVIRSESLAGTSVRCRVGEPASDHDTALHSQKITDEHHYVTQYIQEKLTDICKTISQDPTTSIVQLRNLNHLVRRFRGELLPNVTDTQILNALHPTPAVSGYPEFRVESDLHRLEPFARGWYAGPIGVISPTQSTFAVALRCAVATTSHRLDIYAGAGVIDQSDPLAEWDEIEAKTTLFREILG